MGETMKEKAPPLRIVGRAGHPAFLDLPWSEPLGEWEDERLVEVAVGLSRHVVRFLDMEGRLYALKELPGDLADREYRVLREMAAEGLPVVEAAAVVQRRALDDVLITRYLDYSLPYRVVFLHRRPATTDVRGLTDRLLDALAMLLVRLHLAGFFWGDCSLSNTLFRRDAGALAAYLVDGETGERHPELSRGQRRTELEIAQLNVVGELLDLEAQLGLRVEPDAVSVGQDLVARYERVWAELGREELIAPGEHYLVEARIRRLNELGFDVDEIEFVQTPAGDRVVLKTAVTEQGHHRRRLFDLTGLDAQENQARRLLASLANFRATLEREHGQPCPEAVAAHEWMTEIFLPTVQAIPDEQRGKLDPVEVFHEVLEHKWYLAETAGQDVPFKEATESYLHSVLPAAAEERTVARSASEGWIGYG